jgi:hypothetical protein
MQKLGACSSCGAHLDCEPRWDGGSSDTASQLCKFIHCTQWGTGARCCCYRCSTWDTSHSVNGRCSTTAS